MSDLDPERLAPIGLVAETGSTNADLRAAARAGAPHGTALVADAQRAGRGRLGREWASPAGAGVWLSVLLRGPAPERPGLLSLAVAANAADALHPALRIKWPNDLQVSDGRKVAGILIEAEGDAYVVGIGVNVRAVPWEGAACLAEVAENLDRTAIATALVAAILRAWDAVHRDPDAVLTHWRSRARLGGRVVAGDLTGIAEDVAPDGALLIRGGDGVLRRVIAGDVMAAG